jgi:hypothetical protein
LPPFDPPRRALESGQQRFLRRLGASPYATHSLQAAAALGGCGPVEKAFGVLLGCHLLAPAAHDQFRLPDLIRGYAAVRGRRDDSAAEQKQSVARLLDYYLATADLTDRVLHLLRAPRRADAPHVGLPGIRDPGSGGALA